MTAKKLQNYKSECLDLEKGKEKEEGGRRVSSQLKKI